MRSTIFSCTRLLSLFEGVGSLTGNCIPHFVDSDCFTLSIPSSTLEGVMGRGSIDRHKRFVKSRRVIKDTVYGRILCDQGQVTSEVYSKRNSQSSRVFDAWWTARRGRDADHAVVMVMRRRPRNVTMRGSQIRTWIGSMYQFPLRMKAIAACQSLN